MEVWIPGTPRSKGRPRVANGHAYTPRETKQYEAFIGQCCMVSGLKLEPNTPYRFSFHIRVATKKHGDADNIIKVVLDGIMIGNPGWDDKYATQGEWAIEHVVGRDKEGVLVEVQPL